MPMGAADDSITKDNIEMLVDKYSKGTEIT